MDSKSSKTRAAAAESQPLLRHPGIVTAVAAGVFGLLAIIIKPDFWKAWWEFAGGYGQQTTQVSKPPTPATAAPASTQPPAEPLQLFGGPVSVRLRELQRALAHEVGGKPDIDMRMRALIELVTISGEQPPDPYFQQAGSLLVRYVKQNIDDRRGPGPQVEVDPRPPNTYRPVDIIMAIEGLQAVRRASGGRVEVSLAGVDFHQINLSDMDLEEFILSHADFSYAMLTNCRCRGADFRHAKFIGTAIWGSRDRPADFSGVKFDGADLTGSKWANVNFSGSNIEKAVGHRQRGLLEDAHGLTPEQSAMFR
jgi:hypothetical protein